MPESRLNSVVLPAPFGPMMAKISPGSTVNDTPSTALTPPNSIAEVVYASALMCGLRATGAASAGTMPARRKIMNTIMSRPSAMCS